MISTLKKILKSNRVEGTHHTHVSLIQPKGSFQFNRQTNEEFWGAYCEYIRTDENAIIGVAEKPQHYLPVLADIDLKIEFRSADAVPATERSESSVLYTTKDVKNIIEIYQNVLNQIIDGLKPEELTCVFLSKDPYQITKNETDYLKHGFHLHFPYIFMNKDSQQLHLIPRVKKAITELKLFESIGIEDSGNVVDSACCTVPWLLYGSRKDGEQHKPYLVKYIFDFKLNKISLEDAFKNYSIYDDREHKIDIIGNVEHYLPRILSINSYSRKVKEVKTNLRKLEEQKNEEKINRQEHAKQFDVDEGDRNLETCKYLLNMLSEVRSSSYEDWRNIAWILHNSFEGDLEARELWKEWASKSDKYDENEHNDFWDKIIGREGGLTIRSLHYYAEQDNPREYKKFKTTKSKKYLTDALDGEHLDLARAFYVLEGDKIKIIDDECCYLWDLEKLLWKRRKCSKLLSMISDCLTPKYHNIVKEIYAEQKDANITGDKSKDVLYTAKIKQVQKIIHKLKNASFLKSILTLYVSEFQDDEFESKINSEKFITPIKNGKVIDLRTKEFRTREKTDFFSFECPVKLVQDTSMALRFLDSLSGGQKDHTDYLIRLCGYFMTGDVSHRGFYISWGVGCNGKSSLINILKSILGKFFVSISEDVFIKKDKGGGGATPELMPLIGARLAVLSETDEKEKLNSKRIKSLTGSDTISARALYKDQINFVPHCKIMMLTNVKPEFDATDLALIDRLNFIPFPARFEKTKANTEYIDSLTTEYLDQFFTLFCEGAQKWFSEGEMMDSKICIDGKIKYKEENDTFRDFINMNVVEHKGQNLPCKDLFNAYKSYCLENDIRPDAFQKFNNRVETEFYKKESINRVVVFLNCRFVNSDENKINPML